MQSVRSGTIYRHYKGKLYYVLAVAKHSETQEDFVVYIPLYESDVSPVWIRPLSMFIENVQVNGRAVPRFQPMQ